MIEIKKNRFEQGTATGLLFDSMQKKKTNRTFSACNRDFKESRSFFFISELFTSI